MSRSLSRGLIALLIAEVPVAADPRCLLGERGCPVVKGLSGEPSPMRLTDSQLVVPAAIAFGALATGATLYQLGQPQERPLPPGTVVVQDPEGRPHLELPLIPAPAPISVEQPQGDLTIRPTLALRINDTATNIALAVGGAALAASIISSFFKK